jgi:50S ribosomal protein L16 3-hydroxylase
MNGPLGELGPRQFLEEYWQKKPCLIRKAISPFKPVLDGNDLAGLACEEMAESRLVKGTFEAEDWSVEHGPFNAQDFSNLPAENWTLLVQDVEKHYAPLLELVHEFSFIPSWRLDDLMISYAVRGGSVGPHTDQYDVFLLQASGTRNWQIASSFEPELLKDCPLNVLKHFEAEQEWILEPGDILYLPPDIAHYGVAIEPGMTWSIGSRAPSGADLLQGLGEWLASFADEGGRYSDPGLQPGARAGEIDEAALERLRNLMMTCLADDKILHNYLAAFMSRFRLAHEPLPLARPLKPPDVLAALKNGSTLFRNPWTRLAWVESDGQARLYAAGQAYDCSLWLAGFLCQDPCPGIDTGSLGQESLEVLTSLINDGHFLFMDAGIE